MAACLLFSGRGTSRAGDAAARPAVRPFYFAVSAMTSPARTLVHFAELTTYLAARLKRPVRLKQRRTYAEINELLAQGRVGMAFTCTGGYLAGRRDFGLELFAVPVVKGSSYYRSYIVVRRGSPYHSFSDLRGRVFAYADPLSLSGYIYPATRLKELGYGCGHKKFFRHEFFTESHDKSIEAVATGIADGAAVDSLIFDALRQAGDPNARRLKIIEKSGKFGMPPVVVAPDLNLDFRYRLLKVMLSMDKNSEGQAVLRKLGMDRFIIPDPALYRSAFLLYRELE
ncbi:phosphate/phosphite/phosphonate ABC transporter substrate-binding protein [Desulfobacterota bacterium M19]